MVVGGWTPGWIRLTDVAIVSTEPEKHPVPACLKKGGQFPVTVGMGMGSAVGQGK